MLRQEINFFNQYRQQLMYSSALILGAIVGGAATAATWLGGRSVNFGAVCLVFSFVFSVGGLLFAELRWRIFRAALYLHTEIRAHVRDLCGRKGLLGWETFLGHKGPLQDRKYWLVENIGWLIFLGPASLFAIFAACFVVRDLSAKGSANGAWDIDHWVVGVLAAALVAILLAWVWLVSIKLMRFTVASEDDAADDEENAVTDA